MISETRISNEADLGVMLLTQANDPTRCPADLASMMTRMAITHFLAARRLSEGHTVCPGCSDIGVLTDDPSVLRCQGCDGVFTTEPITLEQALKFVRIADANLLPTAKAAGTFYFDLEVLYFNRNRTESQARRLHGWADRATKRMTQLG